MVDMAHIAGLVAGGVYPSPVPFADVITSTTHKTLRGPRGAIILWNKEEYTKKINSAVFPGMQGGPLMHVIAAKCVAFGEALSDNFKTYAKNVVKNAQSLCKALQDNGFEISTGGTDCHLLVVDLSNFPISGKEAEEILEKVGLTCNKNAVAFDKRPPAQTSGIRLGTPAGTTRGLTESDFYQIGQIISDVLLAKIKNDSNIESVLKLSKKRVSTICKKYPLY
jgi:glycine hydroxymethyltransferase